MPEQNLNPDALEAFARATYEWSQEPHGMPKWEDAPESLRERVRVSAGKQIGVYLSALPAQPETVNSVEEIPAKIQIISWEEEPEHECWKLAPDETFVGLIVKADRSWSAGDQYTLNVSRPVD